jgi:pectate lyase
MKPVKLFGFAFIGICLVGLALQNCPANEDSKYLDAVKEFADNVLKYGRDTYGPKHTPLFVDGLNIHTHEPVKWIAPNGDRWILSNLASQQNLFRTLDGLTTITGDPKYRQAAMEAIEYAFDNLRSPNGLLYWGCTTAYDAQADKQCGSMNHVLKGHYPYYELMWDVDPRATKQIIESFWAAHVINWSNLDMNRIGSLNNRLEQAWKHEYQGGPIFLESTGRNKSFINTGTDLVYAAAWLTNLSGDNEPLVWAKRLARRYVRTRHPETGISYWMYTKPEWEVHEFYDDIMRKLVYGTTDFLPSDFPWGAYSVDCEWYHILNLTPGIPTHTQVFYWECLLLVGDMLSKEGDELKQWALEELTAFGKASYRRKDNVYVPILTDGTNLEGYICKEGSIIGPKGATLEPVPANPSNFWAYAIAYRVTGDEFMWEMANSIALGNEFGDIGITSEAEPELNMQTNCSDPYALLGFLELYKKTGSSAFLKMAKKIGDNLLTKRFHKGFFVESNKNIFTEFDAIYSLVLLRLHSELVEETASMPKVWPSMPSFRRFYRRKDVTEDNIIYRLTASTEIPVSLQEAAAISDVSLVKSLIEQGVNVDFIEGADNQTALHRAAMSGHKDVVELLLANGADIDAGESSCKTPLHYAVEKGYNEIAELLIAKGADVNAKNNSGQTPLDIALSRNRIGIVKLLAEAGADVSIHVAARCGILTKVKSLIKEGCDINTKDSSGKTPLHYAVEGEQKDVVEFLITNGADINIQSGRGETPLRIAAIQGHREIAELLIANNAVIKKRQGLLGRLFSTGADTSEVHLAACSGDIARLKHFVEEKSDVNLKDNFGWTPLFWAVSMGRKEAVEFLIASGADIHVKVGGSMTLLHRAAEADKPGMAELLISKGLDVDAAAWGGLTPLHIAARAGNRKVAEILINEGADVNSRNSGGQTPLHLLAYQGHKDTAELLISEGADLDAKNTEWNQTPLDIAAYYGYREVVELIKKHKSPEVESPAISSDDINKKTYHYRMPLHKAAAEADLDRVEFLVDNGADVNAESNDGWTALHRAAVFGHADIVKLLLANGAKVNTVNRWGWMPLHSAALYGHKAVVELLIANDANIGAKTPADEIALQIAVDRGYTEVADLLRKHKAEE